MNMDINKQPGIRFNGALVSKCNYWRNSNVSPDIQYESSFHYEKSIDGQEAQAILSTKLLGKSNDEVEVSLECTYVGLFSIHDENKNMDLERFMGYHAPALLFPYIRQFIHNLTLQSGIEPIIFPPLNILSLLKEAENKTIDQSET